MPPHPLTDPEHGASARVNEVTRQSTRRWWRWLAVALLAIALAGGAYVVWDLIDLDALRAEIDQLNSTVTVLLMATLPIGGFSIALVHVVAGAKFGPWLGGAVVAVATACHLLGTHWVARSALRGPLDRWFARHRGRFPTIPHQDDVAVTMLVALIPGPPYFLRNYFLALAGIPLRVYFWTCLPIYVAHGYVAIFLGDLGAEPEPRKVAVLVGLYVVKLAVCAEVLRRLRKRHARSHRRSQPAVAEK